MTQELLSQKNILTVLICFLLNIVVPCNAVVNGKLITDSRYSAIGGIKVGNDKNVSCTATLVSDKWIITASHCTYALSGGEEDGKLFEPSEYEFRLGVDFNKPFYKSKIKQWVRLENTKDFDSSKIDIALGELQNIVPLKKLKLIPIKISNQSWSANDLKTEYLHVGYGLQSAYSEDKFSLFNKRQLAQLSVTSVNGNALINLFGTQQNFRNYLNTFHPNIKEEEEPIEAILANSELTKSYSVHAWDKRGREDLQNITVPQGGWQDTCFGDSGGPLLKLVGDQLQIVGVVSQGMNRTCEAFGTKFTVFGNKILELFKAIKIYAN